MYKFEYTDETLSESFTVRDANLMNSALDFVFNTTDAKVDANAQLYIIMGIRNYLFNSNEPHYISLMLSKFLNLYIEIESHAPAIDELSDADKLTFIKANDAISNWTYALIGCTALDAVRNV